VAETRDVQTPDESVCTHCDRGVIDVPGPITAEVCPWCKGNYRAPPPAVDEATVERVARRIRVANDSEGDFAGYLAKALPEREPGAISESLWCALAAAARSPEILAAIQRVASEVRRGT
jgi:hypothetical protein